MTSFVEIKALKQNLGKRSLVYGIGINDAWYQTERTINKVRVKCPYYITWKGMLYRCYGVKPNNKDASYLGCTVCGDWLTFSNFRKWMETQDFADKQLDKDILVYGNKLYSPETCIFVSSRVNKLLKGSLSVKDTGTVGVHWHVPRKKYIARCSNGLKTVHLGCFDLEEEAIKAYRTFKSTVILEIAYSVDDMLLKQALINIAGLFTD